MTVHPGSMADRWAKQAEALGFASDMSRGEGLRVRLSRVPGETPKDVLAEPLYFPAVLSGFGWTETFLHSEYDTIAAGQFSQPAMGPATARQLRTTDDVDALAMTWDPVWLVEKGVDPNDVYSALMAAGRSRKPVELLASLNLLHGRPLLRMNITIRSVRTQLREGEPDSTYYSMSFSEWRNATTKRVGAGSGDRLPATRRLKEDDTLASLTHVYHLPLSAWRAIAAVNGIKGWGPHTRLVKMHRFKVGSKIKIPKVVTKVKGGRGG